MTKITLEKINNIVDDIKSDKEWVNDSHSSIEYKGVCSGLDMLLRHLKEVYYYEKEEWERG